MLAMLSPHRRSLEISLEADELELQFGHGGAVEAVCERILQAARSERRRLYRLHDELTRRDVQDEDAPAFEQAPAKVGIELAT